MQRGGTPEEVANAILWLFSDEASYSTGTFIDLAGGRKFWYYPVEFADRLRALIKTSGG